MIEDQAFLALVRGGLWKSEVRLLPFGNIDYTELLCLAEEQSVMGLITDGLEHVVDVKVPKEWLLQFIGQTLQIEQQNQAMNSFIAKLIERMREADIYTLLVKGQGIAQCYEKPLWRACGDVDLLLSDTNYKKAKDFLLPLSSTQEIEGRYSKHIGLVIDPFVVELHGSLRTGLCSRVDKEIDSTQREVFYGGNVRSWMNGGTTVFLPSPDNDVMFVFTHFLMHFYRENMTLRQVCDLCRLLWTYRGKIDVALLEKRLKRAGLMSEWKAFAAIAVDFLGMEEEAMPLYCSDTKWERKADKLLNYILKGYTGLRVRDTISIARIFPYKTFCYLPSIFLNVNWLKIKERMFGE